KLSNNCNDRCYPQLAIKGTARKRACQIIRPIACRPLIIQRNGPAIGTELGRPDDIHRKDINGVPAGTQHRREKSQDLIGRLGRITVVSDMDTVILRIKLAHESCVDAIGVLLKVVNIDGLYSAASTVDGTATVLHTRY